MNTHDLKELIEDNYNRKQALYKLVNDVQNEVRVVPNRYEGSYGRYTFVLPTVHEMKRSMYVLERVLGRPFVERPIGLEDNCTKWILDVAEMTRFVRLYRFPDHAEIEICDAVLGLDWK